MKTAMIEKKLIDAVAIDEKLQNSIGKRVIFNTPEGRKMGILKERCSLRSAYPYEVPYWDVIDLINSMVKNRHG